MHSQVPGVHALDAICAVGRIDANLAAEDDHVLEVRVVLAVDK